MQILYTSDLHGDQQKYQELLQITADHSIDVVILGGDLLPRRGHGPESLSGQLEFIDTFLHPLLVELRRISHYPIAYIFGNNDWMAALPPLKKLEVDGLLFALHGQVLQLGEEVSVTGCPWVPPTPFAPKDVERRDLRKDKAAVNAGIAVISNNGRLEQTDEVQYLNRMPSIEEELETMPEINPRSSNIVVFHSPPYKTQLDQGMNGSALGSRAIRTYIENRQPSITLHGHIHESPVVSGAYAQRMGNTFAINPGQTGGRLAAVIFDPADPEKSLRHTQMDKKTHIHT